MQFRDEKKADLIKYRIKGWTCEDKSSIFFGTHDSGVANIPEGHFPKEVMEEYISSGQLTLVEKE